MDCKKRLNSILNDTLAPCRDLRHTLNTQDHLLNDILASGRQKANETATQTMVKVREAVFSGVSI
jgi:hypothetical protein